ncbi:hypothetical protein CHS0354_019144 [Potamilus streckersoni]|uniref:Monocarboxylate transporter n=1 Tax=Potamilus streckersoni TaxID=2493646 RepID=A0AAE0T0R6_9BIVA|nr:hypothetical protein CHS0354_019144 [Potamilus streckersoni]
MTRESVLYSDNDKEELEEMEEDVHPRRPWEAPDGGWGWMIVLGAFVCSMVVEGLSTGFFVIQRDIEEHYGVQNNQSSIIISLLTGFGLVSGPVASAMSERFGYRKVTIMGSIVTCIVFVIGPNMPTCTLFAVFYGFIGGTCLGLIFLSSVVTVSVWFKNKRSLATGIAMCGSGVGTLVFPHLYHFLLSEYDWKGATFIIAGIVLHCVAGGALFRPLSYAKTKRMKRGVIQRGAIMKALIAEKERQRTISNGSLDNCIITKDNKLLKIDKIDLRNKSSSYLNKLKETLGFSSRSLNRSKNSLIITKGDPIYKPKSPHPSPKISKLQLSKTKCLSTPPTPKRDSGCGSLESPIKTKIYDQLPTDDPWDKQSTSKGLLPPTSASIQNVTCLEPLKSLAAECHGPLSLSVPVSPAGSNHSLNGQKMFLRSASMQSGKTVMLPSELFSYSSVMTVPQFDSIECAIQEEKKSRKLCSWLVEIFHLRLLLRPTFFLLMMVSFLSMLGFYLPFSSLPVFGVELGLKEEASQFLISVTAIASVLGRMVFGWIADRPWANAVCVSNFMLILSAALTILCPHITSSSWLSVFAAGFGFSTAAFMCLRSVVLIELFDLQKLSGAFGLYLMFQGAAVLMANPITVSIKSSLGNSNVIFYMSGGFLLVAGLLGCVLKCVQRWEDHRYDSQDVMLEVVNIEEIPMQSEALRVETCETSM